jgi:LysR family glycine cleavage system transcriptional activator
MRMLAASLPHFRAFEAVARLGSVRLAAGELCVTPGAVSQQLRKLQDHLGVALFERSGRGVRPTEAGLRLTAASSSALAELSRCLEGLAARAAGRDRRRLSVSVPLSLGLAWMVPGLLAFADRAGVPEVAVASAAGAAEVDWRAVEAAVVYDNPPFAGFRWQPLAGVRLRPVLSPRSWPGGGVGKGDAAVADWIARQRLLHEDRGSEWRRWLAAAGADGARRGAAAGRNAFFDTLAAVLAAAEAGEGVALVSGLVSGDALAAGRLLAPVALSVPASRGYFFLVPEARAEDPLLRRLGAWLAERASGVAAADLDAG